MLFSKDSKAEVVTHPQKRLPCLLKMSLKSSELYSLIYEGS